MRAAGILLILLSLGVGGVWFFHGQQMATKTEILIETEKTDEFGDKVVERTWEKGFKLGLDFAGPGGGGLFGLGGLLIFLDARKRKKSRLA